jgi:hypothetical protein
MEKNCKAELTTQQLVTIIILIVSFSVLLFFIFRLNLGGETTNKEICHNSVLMKSRSSFGNALDCRTNYICISGGGKCEGFSSTHIIKIDMKETPEEIKNQTMKAIVNEMADCWWMFGEGKVNYAGGILDEINGNKICTLCSIIKFDLGTNKIHTISSNDFKTFLSSNERSKGISYLFYLYGINDKDKLNIEDISLKDEFIVLTGIAKKGVFENTWKGVFIALPNEFWNSFTFGLYGKTYSEVMGDGEEGHLPIKLIKKSEMNNEGCEEFITKA